MPTFIVGTVDTPNRNYRVYPRKLIEKAIAEYRKQIDEKRALGELVNDCYSSTVCLSNVSHLVTDLRVEGNNVVADIQVLKTPKGLVLQDLLDAEQAEFVTRGLGDLNDGKVVGNYQLVSVDAVVKSPATKV
jgi:hypothetical protein